MNRVVLKGIPVSPGIAMGPGFISETASIEVPVYRIDKNQAEEEVSRFQEAIEDSKRQILDLRQEMEKKLG